MVGGGWKYLAICLFKFCFQFPSGIRHPTDKNLKICGPFVPYETKGCKFLFPPTDIPFTNAALLRITGINERQLWQYASGIRKPRPAQRKRIEEGLLQPGTQLLTIGM